MTPYLTQDGWLRLPYDGPDIAIIEIQAAGTGWQPAYLDWEGGRRVAQVRHRGELPGAGRLRVNGVIQGSWGRQEDLAAPAPSRTAAHPAWRGAGSSKDHGVT